MYAPVTGFVASYPLVKYAMLIIPPWLATRGNHPAGLNTSLTVLRKIRSVRWRAGGTACSLRTLARLILAAVIVHALPACVHTDETASWCQFMLKAPEKPNAPPVALALSSYTVVKLFAAAIPIWPVHAAAVFRAPPVLVTLQI